MRYEALENSIIQGALNGYDRCVWHFGAGL